MIGHMEERPEHAGLRAESYTDGHDADELEDIAERRHHA